MKLFTIGFTRRTAETFFATLASSGATRLVDVRLNNSSQLAGFTKRDDLRYFLKAICQMEYVHLTDLAPTPELLHDYRSNQNWPAYESKFLSLMSERHIETIALELIANSCLLCSEPTADRCHRRLVAEYLRDKWGDLEIVHL